MRQVNASGEGLLFASHERIHEKGSTVASGVGDADGGSVTFRALPTGSLPELNPFLFLSAPQRGLPFGPHPHKGV